MIKDKRYETVGHLIRDHRITFFREIFGVLPKSILAADLWMNNTRFDKLRNNVKLFRLKDLFRVAELLDIEESEILTLILNQYLADQETKLQRKYCGSRSKEEQRAAPEPAPKSPLDKKPGEPRYSL